MDLNDCLEKGLLKKDYPDKEKSKKSLETADNKLVLAKKLFNFDILEETFTSCYAVMFHAARALLFKDGFREKSHYGLFVYIKETYSDRLEKRFINELNSLRLERHEINYGLENIHLEKSDAEVVLKIAEEFITAVRKIIKSDQKLP